MIIKSTGLALIILASILIGCKSDESESVPDPSPGYLFTFNERNLGANNNSTALLPNGDLVLCGYTTFNILDGVIYRVDQNGNELWKKVPSPSGLYTNINSVVLHSNGHLYLSGSSSALGSLTGPDIFIARMNINGDTIWTKSIIQAGNQVGKNIITSQDGGLIISAAVELPSGGNGISLYKLNSDGAIQWVKSFSNGFTQECQYLKECFNGDLIITGWIAYSSQSGGGPLLIKTNFNGDEIWSKVIPMPYSAAINSIVELSNGELFVCGNSDFYPFTYLAYGKLNALGDTLWTKCLKDSLTLGAFNCLSAFDNNTIFISGSTAGYTPWDSDNFIIRVNDLGHVAWSKKFGSSNNNVVKNMMIDNDKLIITGKTGSNVYLAKMDFDGNM